MTTAQAAGEHVVPGPEGGKPSEPLFDRSKLESLMDEAGADWVLASSRHNVQYLLGGYRFFFFENFDAIGLGRYLPLVGYCRGKSGQSFYVAAANEAWGLEVQPAWVPTTYTVSWSSGDSAAAAAKHIRQCGSGPQTIGIEPSFLPADAMQALSRELPDVQFVDATEILEELRAVKRPEELQLVRAASEGIVEAVLATFSWSPPQVTKSDVVEQFRRQLTSSGLAFEYALVATGRNFNRAPSPQRWEEGNVLSLDPGGHKGGYIGDLCRMAVMGQPTAQMEELLGEIAAVQEAARRPISSGALGGVIYEAALAELSKCPHRAQMVFLAHGMGLIPHEAPRLTSSGAIPYPAKHAERPLEAGMVLSIETQIVNPEVGFLKLEDTLIVTDSGWEAVGDYGRGWNIAGSAPSRK